MTDPTTYETIGQLILALILFAAGFFSFRKTFRKYQERRAVKYEENN